MGVAVTEAGQKLRAAEIERASAAWLLACHLASKAVGADVRLVLQTRGVRGRGSDAVTTQARRLACYLATTVANVPQVRLSDATGIDRSTIFKHALWVEEERDRPEFDALVEGLERALVGMAVKVVLAQLGNVAPEALAS